MGCHAKGPSSWALCNPGPLPSWLSTRWATTKDMKATATSTHSRQNNTRVSVNQRNQRDSERTHARPRAVSHPPGHARRFHLARIKNSNTPNKRINTRVKSSIQHIGFFKRSHDRRPSRAQTRDTITNVSSHMHRKGSANLLARPCRAMRQEASHSRKQTKRCRKTFAPISYEARSSPTTTATRSNTSNKHARISSPKTNHARPRTSTPPPRLSPHLCSSS